LHTQAAKKTDSSDFTSASYFEAVSTAIHRLHTDSDQTISVEVYKKLKHFLGGYARMLAQLRKEGQLKASPGGDVIDYNLYREIMTFFWKNAPSSVILFQSLLVNVGARSDNTSDINQAHFGRRDEFVTVNIPSMKVYYIYVTLLSYMIHKLHT
jgi:hypothetical protein